MVLAGTIFPLRNAVHAPLSIAAFTLAVVAVFLIGLGLRQDTRWRAFASYSFVTGVILVGLLLLTIATGQGVLAAWVGLLQRLFIAPLFLWIEGLAIRLLLSSGQPAASPV